MLSAKSLANTTEDAVARSPPIKRRGVKRARMTRSRTKKNDSFIQDLNDGIRTKLKVTSLAPLGAVSIHRGIKAQRFSLVLSGLHYPVAAMLHAVSVMGNSVLKTLLDDRQVRRVFIAFTYAFATAKVAYAQRTAACNSLYFEPIHDMSSDRMEQIACLASNLPKIVAVILDSIGTIAINQTLVPVFSDDIASMSYSSVYKFVMTNHPEGDIAQDTQVSAYWERLKAVFQYTDADITISQEGLVSCVDDLRSAWSMTQQSCRTFTNVIAAMNSVQGLLVPVNIRTGNGTAAQLVRFPTYNVVGIIPWYANLNISDDDIRIASIALTGYEVGLESCSFYETSLDRCLVNGRIDRDAVIRTILMARTSE